MRLIIFAKRIIIAVSVLVALSASARGEFSRRFWISQAGHDAWEHHVATKKSGGNVSFVWEVVGSPYTVSGGTLSSTGVLGPILQISDPNHRAFHPQLAMDGKGVSHYVWSSWKIGIITRTMSTEGVLNPLEFISSRYADYPQ